MAEPTLEELHAADQALFDLTEWDTEMRTWQRQTVRDTRRYLKDCMNRLREKDFNAGREGGPP